MNPLMLMLLLPTLTQALGGGTANTNMSSILPLMLMSGNSGGSNNQGTMLTLMTGNPLYMFLQPKRRSYRRRKVIYRTRYIRSRW